MRPFDTRNRMWSEALEMMSRAERLHRQLFEPASRSDRFSWEPPIDVLETNEEVLVFAALPGVDPALMEAEIQGNTLVIAGERQLPSELRTAVIHRLELPQGRFQRRVALPPGVYREVSHALVNGCLLIRLSKAN
jgi:HSP20 family protein